MSDVKVIGKISQEILGMQKRPSVKCANCGRSHSPSVSLYSVTAEIVCSAKCLKEFNHDILSSDDPEISFDGSAMYFNED